MFFEKQIDSFLMRMRNRHYTLFRLIGFGLAFYAAGFITGVIAAIYV